VLFFGGTLVPALGFVDVFPMRYSFVADHFQYLASIGLLTLFAAYLSRWRVVAIAWLMVLGVLTFGRAMVFHDPHTLWPNTIAQNPTGWMPRNNYATLLISEGKFDRAEEQLAEAVKHNPTQFEPLSNLGSLMEQRGRWADAISWYERALQARPGEATVEARLHLDRGMVLATREDFAGAAAEFKAAVDRNPLLAEAWNNLGAALEKQNDTPAALQAYERALQADPQFEKARRNLGRLRLVR
jgi:tetratricopeptide (TPR) repeat protein